jgi:predicted SAM-dependent methyltransferase
MPHLTGILRRAAAYPYDFSKSFQRRRIEDRRLRAADVFFARQSRPLKLNLGCGDAPLPTWINVDLFRPEKADVLWDLTEPFPLESGCCSFIYHEHVLEHFSIGDGLKLLRECRRLLRPGGVLRVGMPGIDHFVNYYLRDDWYEPEWDALPEVAAIKTRAEMLNAIMRFWGHQYLYDAPELFRRLAEAGFTCIQQVEWGKSHHAELCGLETRKLTTLVCEASP